MEDQQLHQFPEITTGIVENDYTHLAVAIGGADRKLSLKNLAKFILGNRLFGGTGAIVTADDADQTMSKKRIDSLMVNSDTIITANGAEINALHDSTVTKDDLKKLAGVTVTNVEINRLFGITSNVQTAITNMTTALLAKPFIYGKKYTVDSIDGITITAETLLASIGISGGLYVDQNGIIIQVHLLENSTWVAQDFNVTNGGIKVYFDTNTGSGGTHLNNIYIMATKASVIKVSITFKTKNITGV